MVKNRLHEFQPTYAFPPGDTLAEVLESRSMTQVELAVRTGLTPKTVNEIVRGKAPITPDTALHFERALGISAAFWNNLQRRVDEVRAREAEAARLEQAVEWARQFPLRELAKRRWLQLPGDDVEQVGALLNYFGTATPEAWAARWNAVTVAFRSTPRFEVDQFALACWLRQGEIDAAAIDSDPYDEGAFRTALADARSFSRLPGVEFVGRLRDVCAAAGVAVVFAPELPRIRAYGATRWLAPAKALVQLSLRQKTDDQLWFTFFHEAAHILLHPKKAVFLEQNDGDDELEKQADNFASEHLLPAEVYSAFLERGRFDRSAIRAFAAESRIAPGIVVGRLQHDGYVPYRTPLNRLKVRYEFTRS